MGEILTTSGEEIVDDDDLAPAVEQCIDQVTANHARAAGDHDPHGVSLPVTIGVEVPADHIRLAINVFTPDQLVLEKPHAVDERAMKAPIDGKRRDERRGHRHLRDMRRATGRAVQSPRDQRSRQPGPDHEAGYCDSRPA
jgi:hypothetical protein